MADFRKRAFDFYLAQGWSPQAAAALAGNAQWESGGNPTRMHDQGTGVGLFGFRDPEPGRGRRTDLYRWAGERRLDPENEMTQLAFSDYELTRGNEKRWGDALKAATDLQSAQDAVMGYLRPKDWTEANPRAGHGYEGRVKLASELLGETVPRETLPPLPPPVEVATSPDWAPSTGALGPAIEGDMGGDPAAKLTRPKPPASLLAADPGYGVSRFGQGLMSMGAPAPPMAPPRIDMPVMSPIAAAPSYRPQGGLLDLNPFRRRKGGGLLG